MMSLRCAFMGILAVVAGTASADATRYPLPKGAMDVKNVRLVDTGGEQDFFDVRLPYPSPRVLNHYRKVFGSWVECRHRSLWESFADRTSPRPRYVNQLLWNWVRSDDQAIVTLAIRYYSDGSEYRVPPDSNIQHVVLIEYASPQARAIAEKMEATCGPHT